MNRKTTRLRSLLRGDGEIALAPGAFDAVSARLIDQAGFPVISATGAGVSASRGFPDVGLLTLTEVAQSVRSIAQAVDLPVLADADTGYGNAINVMRTVSEFEHAGAAGLHLEDQVTPKKCGQLAGIELISVAEMGKKIEAALAARVDPDFVIVARSDARGVHGLQEAIRRAQAYSDSGADAVLVYGLESEAELQLMAQSVSAPLITHISRGSPTSAVDVKTLERMGYRLVLYPLQPILASMAAIQAFLRALRMNPNDQSHSDGLGLPRDLYSLVGIDEVEAADQRYKVASG